MGCFRCTGSSSKKSEKIDQKNHNRKIAKPEDLAASGDFCLISALLLIFRMGGMNRVLFDPVDFGGFLLEILCGDFSAFSGCLFFGREIRN